MRRLAAFIMVAGLVWTGTARAADPQAVMGTWWTQDRDGVVRISPCSSGLCGTVVGIIHFQPDGSAPKDIQGRSRCNLQIIPGGTAEADGSWDSHITNPDDGKTYTITLRVDPDGRLRMRGYIGIPLFGRTVFWTRFKGHLTADCHLQN